MGAVFNQPADLVSPVIVEIVTTCDVVTADGGTQRVVNVYHYARDPGNPGTIDLPTLGSNIINDFNGTISNALSTAYTGATATARILDDPTSLPVVLTPPASGGITGDRLPTFNAVSVDLITSARGRCFRGRKHFAPIAEGQTTLDELTAGGQTLWDAVATLLGNPHAQSDSGANTYRLCVLSRTNSTLVGPSINFTYAIVSSAIASPKLGTMKRRKEGVGV
jgi:hypothetical protein